MKTANSNGSEPAINPISKLESHYENKFKDLINSKRMNLLKISDRLSGNPNFLINIPNIGSVLLNLNYQKKISAGRHNEKFFHITEQEIELLEKIQTSMQIPVWLAFTDIESPITSTFYTCSLSVIIEFWLELKHKVRSNSYDKIIVPNMFLSKITKSENFKIINPNIDEKIYDIDFNPFKYII
jgi:hypothetical protein